jgi:hypothetical protein
MNNETLREAVARAIITANWPSLSDNDVDEMVDGYLFDADAALSLMQPEIDRRVAEEKADLESKFRCVVSHATGGNFQDIDASLNEISVRISQFRTQLWGQAKQSGAKEERAKLLERFDEDELEQIISDSLNMDWRPRDAARAIQQAMLAQYEKDNSHEQAL